MKLSPAEQIFHSAIRDRAVRLLPGCALGDRERLGLLLEGAGLLSLLAASAWHLTEGWSAAGLADDGTLAGMKVAPGAERVSAAESLSHLLELLFGPVREIAGRGCARVVARRLAEHWCLPWIPLQADAAVRQLLDQANFLWRQRFSQSRAALAGAFLRGGERETWIAGPRPFRQRILAQVSSWNEARRALAASGAQELWPAAAEAGAQASELARKGQWRAAVERWRRNPPRSSEERLELARSLFALGRFRAAAEVVKRPRGWPERLLRLSSLRHLGELATVRRDLARLERESLEIDQIAAITEIAARLHATHHDVERARRWFERAASAQKDDDLEAHLAITEAQAAWDRQEYRRMRSLLARSSRLVRHGASSWRWRHTRALLALAEGDGSRAAMELRRALSADRRSLRRFEAGALWNDLVLARAMVGDLAGAERACLKAVHLLAACEGPRRTTLALFNLAEIRLRRGRSVGVKEILERSTRANLKAGNTRGLVHDAELWIRYEWVRGRPQAALERVEAARRLLARAGIEWHREELAVFAARTLGWLGRSSEAAAEIHGVGESAFAELEAEERPALWALAGNRDRALRVATGMTTSLWKDLLTRGEAQPESWAVLDSLEPYRAARLVVDARGLEWVQIPERRLRNAAATLRRLGAVPWAELLEVDLRSPWQAVSEYFEDPPEDRALGMMYERAGYGDARVILVAEDGEEVVQDGVGGGEEISAPLAGARVLLKAPMIDPALKAIFAITVDRLRGGRPPSACVRPPQSGSLVGEHHDFRAALHRLERLAAEEVPILIEGESGTGKELAARYAHRASSRRDGPFLAINCAALSESLLLSDLFGHVRGAFTGADRDRLGVFESVRGGTVFLDEIGDLPPVAQGMLLRVLQEGEIRRVGETNPRKVDARVLAATHRDLGRQVREGGFRQDLLYRLRVGFVKLPPLRHRGSDVLLLANHLLIELGRRRGREVRLSAVAAQRLLSHDWPGNIRELENVLQVATALAEDGVIEVRHLELPEVAKSSSLDYHRQIDELRRRLVRQALDETDGNQAEAARRLGMTRQALNYLLKSHGIAVGMHDFVGEG